MIPFYHRLTSMTLCIPPPYLTKTYPPSHLVFPRAQLYPSSHLTNTKYTKYPNWCFIWARTNTITPTLSFFLNCPYRMNTSSVYNIFSRCKRIPIRLYFNSAPPSGNFCRRTNHLPKNHIYFKLYIPHSPGPSYNSHA